MLQPLKLIGWLRIYLIQYNSREMRLFARSYAAGAFAFKYLSVSDNTVNSAQVESIGTEEIALT